MATTPETDAAAEEKPKKPPMFTIYTSLLAASFVALCVAIGLLALELYKYDFRIKPGPDVISTPTGTP